VTKSKAIIGSYIGVLVYAAIVFVVAGRFAYWQGLLYVALAVVGTTVSHALVPASSDVTVARASEAGEGEAWDKRLLRAYFLASVVTFATAGMDSGRFQWSGNPPVLVNVIGALLLLGGQTLFAFAKRENSFFSSTVRIQSARNHRVCSTGPYRIVRHPGYTGMLMALFGFPLVMGSWWAFIPALACAALLVVRTIREDRFLSAELPGYQEYAEKTPSRLFPGLF
jgi:protein-S-isoprenylcysteine O-methyltransferase Ste14